VDACIHACMRAHGQKEGPACKAEAKEGCRALNDPSTVARKRGSANGANWERAWGPANGTRGRTQPVDGAELTATRSDYMRKRMHACMRALHADASAARA